MKNFSIILLSSIVLWVTFLPKAKAQNTGNCGWPEMNEAKKNYDIGNFDEAVEILTTCLPSFDKNNREEALSVLGKIYFEKQNDSLGNIYVNRLLELNPNFKPLFSSDPVKFINAVREIKTQKQRNIVTGISKKAENVSDAPAFVLLITGETIKNRGYLDLEAVVHDLPGFDISRSNGNLYSHVYQRGYRSINTNRTLLLIDGVEENDLWSSNVYLSRQYSLSNIKNIEFVYGPASTMYGSNAFLGVMNVITKEPDDFIKAGNNIGFESYAGYGSYNTKFVDATAAIRGREGRVALSLTGRVFYSDEQDLSSYPQHDFASYTFDEDGEHFRNVLSISDPDAVSEFLNNYSSASSYFTINADNTVITPTDFAVNQAIAADNTTYDHVSYSDITEAYSVDTKLRIADFLLGWNYWSKAEGTGGQYTDLIFLTDEQGGNWRPIHNYLYAKYRNEVRDGIVLSSFTRFKTHTFHEDNNLALFPARYYLGSYSLANLIDGVPSEPINLYLYQKSNQLRQEIKTVITAFDFADIVAGFEARFSSLQGDYLSASVDSAEEIGVPGTNIDGGNQFFSRDIGAYAQAGFKITNKLTLTAGIRYDNNRVRDNQGYGNSFNPRFAVVFRPENCTFKLIYAEAFKDANNREKYSTAEDKRELPNPFLQPEKVKNYEFVFGKKFSDEALGFTASAYYARYSNIIQEVKVQLSDGSSTNQNQAVGQAEIYGLNGSATYEEDNFSAWLNYTYTQPYTVNPTDSEGNPQTDSLGNAYERLRISDIANHRINFGANYAWRNSLNFNLRANFSSKRIVGYNTTVPTNTAEFKPYIVFNASILYNTPLKGLSAQFSIYNILNTEYYHPGLDYAAGDLASQLIQNRRNMYISLRYSF